jgi:hypothetical protein
MDIERIKPKKTDFVMIGKKTIYVLSVLIILGLVTGLILSNFFYAEANQKIDNYNEKMREWYENWSNYSWCNYSWSNTSWGNYSSDSSSLSGSNQSSYWPNYDPYLKKLTPSDVILPSLGVISCCISAYLLVGLIVIYIRVFLQSGSSFITGLLFVFIPLFIITIFFVNTLRSLYFSSAFQFDVIGNALGFGIGGLGGIISIISLFEIIGLSILIYLTME